MIEEQLITTIAEALKAEGFTGINRQKSSRSATVSATKDERRAVVHIADPEPAPGPRSAVNPAAPAVAATATLAFVPTRAGSAGSGVNGAGAATKASGGQKR